MITGSTILFYLLAALTLGCGILSVATRHIFRAAIYLLFSLIGIAGLYFWLQYEFIAAVQIVVSVSYTHLINLKFKRFPRFGKQLIFMKEKYMKCLA